MKNQTAINFLAIELINKSENDYSYAQPHKIITIDLDSFYQLVEKSLIMEKQQIIDAYKIGYDEGLQIITKYENVEDYYTSTYE
jgi:hypothetical protein